ncbi:unnamed protein product [Ambrosiozyma monospora]|uniref:Unnamed protein product n=1 Tax=Ambrosiozyma monospora TaxID=43982 RepID=A0ACB5TW82_AMBMO|nr:unnamed protein product [Ambrosiozyma monospora]
MSNPPVTTALNTSQAPAQDTRNSSSSSLEKKINTNTIVSEVGSTGVNDLPSSSSDETLGTSSMIRSESTAAKQPMLHDALYCPGNPRDCQYTVGIDPNSDQVVFDPSARPSPSPTVTPSSPRLQHYQNHSIHLQQQHQQQQQQQQQQQIQIQQQQQQQHQQQNCKTAPAVLQQKTNQLMNGLNDELEPCHDQATHEISDDHHEGKRQLVDLFD